MAQDETAASALLARALTALDGPIYVDLADSKPTLRAWLLDNGFHAQRPLTRMVLGRSTLPGAVYAGTDVFALGAVPDDPHAVPTGLRGAHIGLHTWYNDWTLGKNATDGCIRWTAKASAARRRRRCSPT